MTLLQSITALITALQAIPAAVTAAQASLTTFSTFLTTNLP